MKDCSGLSPANLSMPCPHRDAPALGGSCGAGHAQLSAHLLQQLLGHWDTPQLCPRHKPSRAEPRQCWTGRHRCLLHMCLKCPTPFLGWPLPHTRPHPEQPPSLAMALVPSKCTLTPRYESQNPSAPHLWVMVSLKPSSMGPCTPQSHTYGAQCLPGLCLCVLVPP